jgi:hypothetical protein
MLLILRLLACDDIVANHRCVVAFKNGIDTTAWLPKIFISILYAATSNNICVSSPPLAHCRRATGFDIPTAPLGFRDGIPFVERLGLAIDLS